MRRASGDVGSRVLRLHKSSALKAPLKAIAKTCLMVICRSAAVTPVAFLPLQLSRSNAATMRTSLVCLPSSGVEQETVTWSTCGASAVAANLKWRLRLVSNLLLVRTFAVAALQSGTIDAVDVRNELNRDQKIGVVTDALDNYLQRQKGLFPKDAEFISKNCPVFITKVLGGLRWSKRSKVDDGMLVEQWLKKKEINELEPFLESIGMNAEKLDEVLPFVLTPLTGEEGLLRSMEILESIGICRRKLWDVLERNKQLLTLTTTDLREIVDFLEGLGVKRKDMLGLIQDSFFLTDHLATLQNLEKIGIQKHVTAEILKSRDFNGPIDMPVGCFRERVDFLLESGLSKSEVAESLKLFPQLLHLRLENLKRKIQFFDSIGLQREKIAKIIARWPLVFRQSVEEKLRPKIAMLQSLGVGRDGIAKILTRYPELGAVSLEGNLKQKVAFFEANGLTGRRLVNLMTSHPRALTLSMSDLNRKLDFLVQNGFVRGSVEMLRALGSCITISVDAMEARFRNLESLGFSFEEGREIVKQQPAILTLSEKCIQAKVSYLRNQMDRSIEEIMRCPCYLLYSLELRIKPRHRVLSLLKSEGMLREEAYSLNTIMIMSERKFFERFVISLGAKLPQVAAAYHKRPSAATSIDG